MTLPVWGYMLKRTYPDRWGAQQGLLSEAECQALDAVIERASCMQKHGLSVLEVGHYCGLSTAVIAAALQRVGGGPFVTVDHHQGDAWVPKSKTFDSQEVFEKNWRELFPWATYQFRDSKTITEIQLLYDLLFYDGDHGEEQLRFIMMAEGCKRIGTIVLDDIDFSFGQACDTFLRSKGWRCVSRPTWRGPGDKMDPETYSLGIYER